MPLNIDWQQILLHWMNLAILTGGLYILLYKPVKGFIAKREEHYRQLDEQAAQKLAEAERVHAEYQAKLDGADEEIHQARAKAQQAIQQSTEDQLAQAKEQARQIVAHAQTEAEQSRERVLRESQRELRKLAAQATKKLAFQADPFDQFLDLAEEGEEYEE
ncbi:MAG: ATP synthase F0 subunit B [Lawsonibacter sp.]|jgi:F-type H+-transporting ATPase subunit b|uniref:ATP synthase F0 subunit B n=1 Tax=Lawsonibacter sp. JLR.KK007 TaxID=3114293 RepID=UPI0021736246|nr:ATP synthase F0 subunit B [Lawsonibacter sp.]MCI9267523.1 ATP synthase F0 subunit B [Lawsonibacter sp.]